MRKETAGRTGEALVSAFAVIAAIHSASYDGCLAIVRRLFPQAGSRFPVWLVVLGGLAGAGFAVGNWTTTEAPRKLEPSSYVAFAAMALLLLTRADMFVLLVASGLLIHGTLGLTIGSMRARGKAGVAKLHVGLEARLIGLVFIAAGFAGVALLVDAALDPGGIGQSIVGRTADRPKCR